MSAPARSVDCTESCPQPLVCYLRRKPRRKLIACVYASAQAVGVHDLTSIYRGIRESVLFFRCLLSSVAIYFMHKSAMKMEIFAILPT